MVLARSVTEGARRVKIYLLFAIIFTARRLLQSSATPAPSRREPCLRRAFSIILITQISFTASGGSKSPPYSKQKQKRGAKCASYIFTLCHTAEWYSRFTRVIFALRRVVLLRSGIREMCERYSRTSCECRAAEGGLTEIMLFLSSFIKVIRNRHIQRRPKKHAVLLTVPR